MHPVQPQENKELGVKRVPSHGNYISVQQHFARCRHSSSRLEFNRSGMNGMPHCSYDSNWISAWLFAGQALKWSQQAKMPPQMFIVGGGAALRCQLGKDCLWSHWHPSVACCSRISCWKIKDAMISYLAAARKEYKRCTLLETNWTVNQKCNPASNGQRHSLHHREGLGRALVELESTDTKQSWWKWLHSKSRGALGHTW